MLHKSCPNNLKKIVRSRVEGVNLIGSNVVVFTRKSFTEVSKYAEGFVPYKHPKPLSSKVRGTLAMISVFSLFITLSYFTFKWLTRVNAAAQNYTWDFSTSGDYVVTDANYAEVADGRAQLRVQNYEIDGNTQALFHFDSIAGNTAADSSGNNNTGVITSGSWADGNLNYALGFNGTDTQIVVPDSASTSLTGANSLEAWVKFDAGFSQDYGGIRQGIIDKGTYQLFFDSSTGKLTYELDPSAQNTWTQVAGGLATGASINNSWGLNGKPAVSSIVSYGSYVYAGLGISQSDAEVWRYDGSTWAQIGGDGLNNGWADEVYEEVAAMAVDSSGNLYVALGTNQSDAEVWMWNGSTWGGTRIGGKNSGGTGLVPSQYGWNGGTPGPYEQVNSLVHDGTYLYAGLGNSSSDAEVWRYDVTADIDAKWTKIGGDNTNSGWSAGYDRVLSLTWDGTYLYAGLGITAGEAEVWKFDPSAPLATSWSKLGGDGTGVSPNALGWGSGYEGVYSLVADANYVYAGLGLSTGDAEVWRYDKGTSMWSRFGGDGTGWANSTYEYVYGIALNGADVYVGLGSGNGDGEVWRYQGGWLQIGGDGVAGGGANATWNNNSFQQVRAVYYSDGTLYAGLYQSAGSGEVWTYDVSGHDWNMIAGNFINKSWGFYGLQSVEYMRQVGDYLYAGTGRQVVTATHIGTALVWRFNGSTWELIGGQGINNSWDANTYEYVNTIAGYNGKVYAGLGNSTGDAEVWEWDGIEWVIVGGDGSQTSPSEYGWNSTHENVMSLLPFEGYLYAGLGLSGGDSELWRYDGSQWEFIAGDGTGWTTAYEQVDSLEIFQGKLHVGLGTGNGDADIYRWDGGTTWVQIGGDTINDSWASSIYNEVYSMAVFKGDLYVGLGTGAGESEVWKWDGSTWGGARIGGDGDGSTPSNQYGWADGTYERVQGLVVYNGELCAALGYSAGDGEVWCYNPSRSTETLWTKVGGDGAGWGTGIEYVTSLNVFSGKLYAGTGYSANVDAQVWAYGDNYVLQESSTAPWNTDWHHIAATYDGSNMRLYIDGSLDNTLSTGAFSISDTVSDLIIGSNYGERRVNGGQGYFKGLLDEIRISNIARTSFNSTPYTPTPQAIRPQSPQFTTGVGAYQSFTHDPSLAGSVTYRISNDGGSTWQYWNGSWTTSAAITEASSASDINSNLDSLPILVNPSTGVSYGLLWQAVLDGDGNSQVYVDDVQIGAAADDSTICVDDFEPDYSSGCQNPTPASSFSAQYVSGGATVASGTWSNSLVPSFSWSGASDDTDGDTIQDANESGVAGYWVYWGDEESDSGCTNDPQSVGTFQVGASYTPTLTVGDSGKSYCLRIRTSDKAGNLSSIFPVIGSDSYYLYRLDAAAPTDPELRVTPESVSLESISMYIEWNYFGGTPGSDCGISESCSGINTYLLKTGTTNPADALYGWQPFGNIISSYTSPAGDIAYKEGVNNIYLKTIDLAGNTSAGTSVSFSYNGETPEAVSNLTSTPVTASDNPSATNSFTFSWDVPENYSAKTGLLEYIYTINVPVPEKSGLTDCIAAGDCRVTSLTGVEGIMATRQVPLANTFYVVARDTGNQNYEIVNTASLEFYVQTPAPGIPRNIDIADVSVKSEESWKIALSWEVPSSGSISTYEIYRSLSSSSGFSEIGSTNGGIAYFDVGLSQQTYYYKVRACDAANSCGEFTSVVDMYPTGKFTESAGLSSDPEVTNITTKRATISWVTDRTSDSKIAYGKKSDDYFDSEPSNSSQVTDHEILLTDLSPGTKYYFVAKWTDEDGNTGVSDEVSFNTSPAPTIEDPKIKVVGIDRVTLEYTAKGASKVRIYYGETSAFGGTVEINTSTDSQTYNTIVENLKDGTKYYYKINTFDSEDDEYDGNILTFETLPRPKVTNVRIQQVKGTAQPTVLVVWETNTEVSSIVTYYPASTPAAAKDVVNINLETGRHRMVIEGLLPQTPYSLIVSGRDKAGNEARSEVQTFTTATDTRPPLISNMRVEGTIVNTGGGGDAEKMAQLLISWDTDEAATSQIEFGEGSGTVYSQRTQEDTSLTYNHVVVISNLVPSRVYHLRALSKDSATNEGFSIDTVTITPKATDSALNLVIQNLSQIFGFLNGLGT